MQLRNGGSQPYIDGQNIETDEDNQSTPDEASDTLRWEYTRLYQRFFQLVRRREVDIDTTPLGLVADAFLLGERVIVEPFV